jgi:hypothetical protein
VSLRPIDAASCTASEIDNLIKGFVENLNDGHKDKIIRLVIENIPRSVQADLDYSMIRKLKSEALHLELQFRRPSATPLSVNGEGTGVRSRPLEEEWREFAGVYESPAGVDRKELAEVGLRYLSHVSQEGME